MLHLLYIKQPILQYAITFLVSVMGSLLTYISVYIFFRHRMSKAETQWKRFYGDVISQVVLCENETEVKELLDAEEISFALYQKSKSRRARLFFIEQLLHFKKQIKGSAEQNLQWLYLHLQLHKDSLRRLRKGNWKQKAKAIQELSQLGNHSFSPSISHYTAHRNLFVRNEAQLALVRLEGLNGLSFLNDTLLPMSKWHQLSLLHEISFRKTAMDERLRQWLGSKNESVVLFSLLLVEVHQCYERHDDVVICLYHTSHRIRQKALYTLLSIVQEKSLQHLVNRYPVTDASGQCSILNAMQEHGTVQQLPFLFSVLHESNETHKQAAAQSIEMITKDNPHAFAAMMKSDNDSGHSMLHIYTNKAMVL